MSVDLRNDPDWRTKAPFGLHVDGTPLTQQEYEGLKGGKKAHIELSVSSKEMENTLRDNISKDQQIKDLEEKLNLVAEVAWEKKKKEVGCNDPTVNDPESLMAWEKGRNSNNRQPQNVPSGTVPLSSQTSANSNPQAWGDVESMINSVRDLASNENPDKVSRAENQKILDTLMTKALKGQKEGKQDMTYQQPKDVSLSDILNEKYRRRKALRGK
jgi:hypothetical protein